MPDYTTIPIVLINNYVWALANGQVEGVSALPSNIWNTANFQYKPFYPITENLAPESKTTPYVLYDYIFQDRPNTTFYAIYREEATYTIIGDIPQIFYVKNFIYDNLTKMDDAAREINKYSNSNINFKWISCKQDSFVLDEKRIDSYKPKYITTLKISYEYTK